MFSSKFSVCAMCVCFTFRSDIHWGVSSYLASFQRPPGGRHQRHSHRWPGPQHWLQQGRQYRLHWVPGGLQSGAQTGQQGSTIQWEDRWREVFLKGRIWEWMCRHSWFTQDESNWLWWPHDFITNHQQVDILMSEMSTELSIIGRIYWHKGATDIHQKFS